MQVQLSTVDLSISRLNGKPARPRIMAMSVARMSLCLLICSTASAASACEAQPVDEKEEIIFSKQTETTIQTEHPLITAEVLRIGDAVVVASEIVGQAYMARKHAGHVELKAGTELSKGDFIELMPSSRLVLEIAGHSAEFTSADKGIWYKLE